MQDSSPLGPLISPPVAAAAVQGPPPGLPPYRRPSRLRPTAGPPRRLSRHPGLPFKAAAPAAAALRRLSSVFAPGDPRPSPLQAGRLRLYSMLFCPYAQRPRLVLAAKAIPHDEVDVNLLSKPEWYSSVHPEAKVPALEVAGGQVVIESLDISDYLDCKFPGPPLWPADPETKARHRQLLDEFAKVYMPYVQCMMATEPQAVMEVVPTVVAAMRPFEEELSEAGTKFFGGDGPGMLDYMIWPWAERCEAIRFMYPQLTFPTRQFPQLLAWGAAMKEDPGVRASIMKPERHADFIRKFAAGTLDYNKL